jgi:predicted PP-loop superfamily ATPase
MAQDPRLRAALENADRETADAVSSLRAMTASIKREHEQFKKERDKRREERAKEAREGTLGRDMQRLQTRVDRRETTWEDVVEGRDNDPSAVIARDHARRNIEELATRLQADPEFVEEQDEVRRADERARAERGEA